MEQRIAAHVERRGENWTTLEEPFELAGALERSCEPGSFVLVDCITLWLTNVMLAEKDLEAEIAKLISVVSGLQGQAALVSNEVGSL